MSRSRAAANGFMSPPRSKPARRRRTSALPDHARAVGLAFAVLRKPSPSVFNCRILDGGSTGRFAPATPSAADADEAAAQAAREAAAYEYPHTRAPGVAAKMSVSELRRGLLEDDDYTHTIRRSDFSRRPAFLGGQAARPAERGTANHVFMQFADFDRVDAAGVRAELNRLLEIRMLSPEQAALVDTAALETFFASALYRRMRVSPALYREKRFTVSEDGARLTRRIGRPRADSGRCGLLFQERNGRLYRRRL